MPRFSVLLMDFIQENRHEVTIRIGRDDQVEQCLLNTYVALSTFLLFVLGRLLLQKHFFRLTEEKRFLGHAVIGTKSLSQR